MKIDQYRPQKLYKDETYMMNVTGSVAQPRPQNKTGHWNEKQNAKYYSFLKKFQEKFNEKQSRRQWKVFKALSSFIKTRDANQCRSHHHKMQRSFQTIQETLNYLSRKNPTILTKSQRYLHQLDQISQYLFVEDNQLDIQKNQKEGLMLSERKHWKDAIFNHNFAEFLYPTKFDIENFKTCANYEIQQPIKYCNNIETNGQHAPKPHFPTPTPTLTPKSPSDIPVQPNYYKKLSHSPNPNPNILQIYQQKVLQCHSTFWVWYNKVTDILRREENLRRFFA